MLFSCVLGFVLNVSVRVERVALCWFVTAVAERSQMSYECVLLTLEASIREIQHVRTANTPYRLNTERASVQLG